MKTPAQPTPIEPHHTSPDTKVGISSAPTPADAAEVFLGRDTSLLEFNRRVLAEAQNPAHPLLERINFLMILGSNLDEFFMKRIALLRHRAGAGIETQSHDGLSVQQQLTTLRTQVVDLQAQQATCFEQDIRPALRAEGILIGTYLELADADRRRVDEWYQANVFPILTPLAVDPGYRFPFISNLSVSLGVLLCKPGQTERQFARLKIPDGIPQFVSVPAQGAVGELPDPRKVHLVPIIEIIQHNLPDVFPGMEIVDVLSFRLTRSTGLDLEDENEIENVLQHVEDEVRQRRFADPVRIETGPDPSQPIMSRLLDELHLSDDALYTREGPLDYRDLRALAALDRPDLKRPTWLPVIPPRLRDEDSDIFSIIREGDVFVHHPYESFHASIERFIATAAQDPQVLAIKQTVYRTSRDSPFIDSLIHAAESGKTTACTVELRARFDESKNVRFARQLEKHGVHVAYGVAGLKIHCKCSLVVRRESDGLRAYAHIGTGNYHPKTAQLYTDCGLLTCDPAITSEIVSVFNTLTGRSLNVEYNELLVAPTSMRRRLEELIDRETDIAASGRPARIIAKMNQLEDLAIIRKLYRASQAGVSIQLIVRGFCCLCPGVPGLSENIRVTSVVGRFLEHSRIFHFSAGHADSLDGDWYLGSADLMIRNLDERVEILTPVRDQHARRRLKRLIEVNLDDRRRAWNLNPDGSYTRLQPDPSAAEDSPQMLGSFEVLCRDAIESARVTKGPDPAAP